jgi:Na+-translocating ferredoxin:NAD+ oxidoreductase subunit C
MNLKTFKPGGVHLHDKKHFSSQKAIEIMPEPQYVVIPLSQHIGVPAKALVKKGDKVSMGQMIGEAQGAFSVPVHASVSGEVDSIAMYPHPVSGTAEAIKIINDGQSTWQKQLDINNQASKLFSKDELLQLIQQSGIVGMGGAAFPSHIKLSPPKENPVDTLIINGAECEPYLTCDHRIMLEKADTLLEGLGIILGLHDFKHCFIGIEENKKDCIDLLRNNIDQSTLKLKPQVVALKEKYPQGAEKSLIYAICKKTVAVGKLPFSVGVIVHNVATIVAIAEAVQLKKPLIERVVTVTGDLVNEPKNLMVRIGTPIQMLIDFCGGLKQDPEKIILGGPMMGISQRSLDVPVTKGVSGVLLMSHVRLPEESACIRCGKCIDQCPSGLMPVRIHELALNREYDKAKLYHAMACIECGICSWQCPAKIPLLNDIRDVKAEINKRSRKS